MSNLTDAIKYMNIGYSSKNSTAATWVPQVFEVIMQRCPEKATIALDYILPEQAYNKPHPGLDNAVGKCINSIREYENAMIKK